MYLYNVTINIEEDVEQEWLRWMKDTHIPEVMSTGRFFENKVMKLLNEQPDATGTTYSIQYFARTLGDIEYYLNHEAESLRQEHTNKYKDKFVAFRTVLEQV
jgi:hypothetical protein